LSRLLVSAHVAHQGLDVHEMDNKNGKFFLLFFRRQKINEYAKMTHNTSSLFFSCLVLNVSVTGSFNVEHVSTTHRAHVQMEEQQKRDAPAQILLRNVTHVILALLKVKMVPNAYQIVNVTTVKQAATVVKQE